MNTCRDCKWHEDSYCVSEKLYESGSGPGGDTADHLVYSYEEGGGFWTGDNFGCVHWVASDTYRKALNGVPDNVGKMDI